MRISIKLEIVQRGFTCMSLGLKDLSYKAGLNKMRLFSEVCRRLRGDLIRPTQEYEY